MVVITDLHYLFFSPKMTNPFICGPLVLYPPPQSSKVLSVNRRVQTELLALALNQTSF